MKPAKEEFPAEVLAASPKQKEFASALRSPHRFLGIWVVIVASRVSFAPALAANGYCVAGDYWIYAKSGFGKGGAVLFCLRLRSPELIQLQS